MSTITPAAVIPVSGGFATNPSYSGTFIPTIWSSKLNVKFYASSTFADCSNTNWEGEIKSLGDKVVINNIPSITINSYTVGSSLTYEVPVPNTIELQIDKAWYFGVNVSDVLDYQSKPDLMDMFTNDASQQLKIKVDTECWLNTYSGAAAGNVGATAGVTSAAYNLGTNASPLTLTTSNILSTITAMSSVLDEQNVPEDGRFLVMSPFERQILMNSSLAQAYVTGDSQSILRNGKLGKIDRFDLYVSNNLPKAAANQDYTGGADAGKVKRHVFVAGHRSAITFAGQIAKTEHLRNPNDFGDLVRGLQVYGRKMVKPEAFTYAIVAG